MCAENGARFAKKTNAPLRKALIIQSFAGSPLLKKSTTPLVPVLQKFVENIFGEFSRGTVELARSPFIVIIKLSHFDVFTLHNTMETFKRLTWRKKKVFLVLKFIRIKGLSIACETTLLSPTVGVIFHSYAHLAGSVIDYTFFICDGVIYGTINQAHALSLGT